jgi:hypothetical protein
MEPTALYYTFSTIAQALAGAFGVLAAFAVLALTHIDAVRSYDDDLLSAAPSRSFTNRSIREQRREVRRSRKGPRPNRKPREDVAKFLEELKGGER